MKSLTFHVEQVTEIGTIPGAKRPAIAMNAAGQARIAVDTGDMKQVHFIAQTGGGFVSRLIAQSVKGGSGGNQVNASRVYVPTVACVDNAAVVAWRCGIKEWGSESIYGPGFCVCPENGEPGPFISKAFTKGAVRIARYDASQVDALSKDGARMRYRIRGTALEEAGGDKVDLGLSGEKLAYTRQGEAWAAGMGGCASFDDSSVCSSSWGSGRRVWCSCDRYTEQGDDTRYVGIGMTPSGTVYLAAQLCDQVLVNRVSVGGSVKFKIGNLPAIGACPTMDRHAVQLVPLRGRMAAVWGAGGSVVGVDVMAALRGTQTPSRLCAGNLAAAVACPGGMALAVTDSGGNVRLVKVKVGKG